ncbi:PAS domain-containing protein [bacterium]|nr:PAS domain-containing protein [bacterium]
MTKPDWSKELPFAITVCDKDGVILEMNQRSIATFEKDGGAALLGTNVLDCHPEPSRSQLADMLKNQTKNIYTIEKNGVKKLICQTPWYEQGEYKGFVELSIELPEGMKHRNRT